MKKGEIWIVEFPSSMNGHEQAGSRPVIVLADTEANISIIIPFTSNLQSLRFPFTVEVKPSPSNGLSTTSVSLAFQMRAVDKTRIKKKIGFLEERVMKELEGMLKQLLGF